MTDVGPTERTGLFPQADRSKKKTKDNDPDQSSRAGAGNGKSKLEIFADKLGIGKSDVSFMSPRQNPVIE